MLALANDSGNAAEQAAAASAPGQTGEAGDSGSAPGHETETETEVTVTETEVTVTETETETFSAQSSTNSNAGGGNSNAGGNSGTTTTSGDVGTSGNHDDKQDGDSCDGDPSGGSDTGHGANTGDEFDSNCPSDDGPAPNGNGGGDAKGKPCAGCVGNADDKNPPGQGKNDKNKGYECDDNKGVGKGNPAHTGCKDDDDDDPVVCDDGNGVSEWTLTVNLNQTVASATHSSQTFATLPADITVTFTAAPGYNTTGLPGGATTATDTATFSNTKCSDAVSHTFTRIQSGSDCESWGLSATVTNGTITAPSEMTDGYHDFTTDTPQSVTFTADEGYSSDGTATGDTTVTITAGAYSAFPECSASVSASFSEIEDVIIDELCPDGLPPDENGNCVRGVIINRPPKDKDPDRDEDPALPDLVLDKKLAAPEAVSPEAVSPAVLPFTGGNLLPFLMLGLGLLATGSAAAMKGRKG